MKVKLKIDKKAIVGFFVQHTEKIVLGGAVVAFAVIVYGATARDSLSLTPEELISEAGQAQRSWQDVEIDPPAPPPDYPRLALGPREPIDEKGYMRRTPEGEPQDWIVWDPPLVPQRRKRGEPPVYAAEGLRGKVDRGRLSIRVELVDTTAGLAGARTHTTSEMQGQRWIVLTALVPFTRQSQEYEGYFKGTQKAKPSEPDAPEYLGFTVQRVEVPSSDAGDGVDWSQAVTIESTDAREIADQTWDRSRQGVRTATDGKFLLDALALPLPPAEREEWDESVAHPPEIPLLRSDDGSHFQGTDVPPDDEPTLDWFDDFGGGGSDFTSQPVAATGPGGRDPQPAADMADEALQYRLLRFFDFDVQPGKRYRYRVRLVLKNPNANEPEQYLSDEVLAKRNDVKQQYALRIAEGVDVEQAKAIARRQWGTIQSAWSEPTNAISVPRDSRLLAGPVQPARDAASEPSGKVTVVTWVKDQGTEVFDEHPVRLGEVINFTSKMTSPLTPSESSDVDHVTDTVVLDLHGGDRLFDDSRLCRPGAILLMDPDGTLTVRQELDDQTERIALRDQAETDVDQPTIQPTGNRRGSPMGAAGHDNLGVLRGGH